MSDEGMKDARRRKSRQDKRSSASRGEGRAGWLKPSKSIAVRTPRIALVNAYPAGLHDPQSTRGRFSCSGYHDLVDQTRHACQRGSRMPQYDQTWISVGRIVDDLCKVGQPCSSTGHLQGKSPALLGD